MLKLIMYYDIFSVQMLQSKNKSLRNEIDSHEPSLITIVDSGLALIEEGHPQSEEFQHHIDDLNARWNELQDAVEKRKLRLEKSELAQQVLIGTKLERPNQNEAISFSRDFVPRCVSYFIGFQEMCGF